MGRLLPCRCNISPRRNWCSRRTPCSAHRIETPPHMTEEFSTPTVDINVCLTKPTDGELHDRGLSSSSGTGNQHRAVRGRLSVIGARTLVRWFTSGLRCLPSRGTNSSRSVCASAIITNRFGRNGGIEEGSFWEALGSVRRVCVNRKDLIF